MGKELDRLLGLTPAEEPSTPNDTVCRMPIEVGKGKYFTPLTSEQELELALRKEPSPQTEKAVYSTQLFKASISLEQNFQIADAEKALEKLVIFDENSNCFEGVAAEHLFHLAINEEKQGKFDEAEMHFCRGVEKIEAKQRSYIEDYETEFKRQRMRQQPESDTTSADTVALDLHSAENYAALARLAKRKGLDEESKEYLRQAHRKDETNGSFLKRAADPANFDQLYADWTQY